MSDPRKVFVIHGRNDDARKAMFTFLRSVGLQPIEWTEAVGGTGQRNPFIGEILDSAFASSQAIIALFTGDDLARLGTRYGHEALTAQARSNVIFEAGMALGRFPDRTILVTLGPNRSFSDLAGRHIVEMNDTVERRQAFVMRLKAAGAAVQIENQTDWQTEGKFDKALAHPDLDIFLLTQRKWPFRISAAILALLAVLLFIFRYSPKSSPQLPEDTKRFISVSGTIVGLKGAHPGIMVYIIPPNYSSGTDSDGTYEITFPWTNVPGSYTAVAYEGPNGAAYVGSLKITPKQITAKQVTFDHKMEDK